MAHDCPDEDILQGLLGGKSSRPLEPDRQAALESHLEGCSRCRAALDRLIRGEVEQLGGADFREKEKERASMPEDLRIRIESGLIGEEQGPGDAGILERLSPSTHPGSLGRFDAYEVLEVPARGGMGVVLRAFDPALDRIVAVKVLAPEHAGSPSARERFLREARAAASTRHENIIEIYAVGTASGLPFLVMPYLPGPTLQDYLESQGPLQPAEIIAAGIQLARGLQAAHENGLIHRDIKPANLLLENGLEKIRLADFGLAWAADDPRITRNGVIAGTPHYLSPEQAQGLPLDARSDLFSAGCVLYALAAGEPPFRGDSVFSLLRQIVEVDHPPIESLRPDFPPALARAIDRLLSKDPGGRFGSAAELAAELERLQAGGPVAEAGPAGRPRRAARSRAAAAFRATAAAVVAAAALVWLLAGGDPEPVGGAPAEGSKVVGIEGRPESYPSLADAVSASRSGDAIILHQTGEFTIEPLRIESKSLSIRAAPDAKPVLIADSMAEPMIATDSSIILEGLTLVQDPKKARIPPDPNRPGIRPKSGAFRPNGGLGMGYPPIIYVSGAPLHMASCRLVNRRMPSRRMPPEAMALELEDCPLLDMANCELFLQLRNNAGIFAHGSRDGAAPKGPCTIRIANSFLVSMRILEVHQLEGQPVRLELSGCVAVSRSLLRLSDDSRWPQLSVFARGNYFDLETLVSGGFDEYRDVAGFLGWNSEGNKYSVRTEFIHSSRQPLETSPKTLEEWNDLMGRSVRSSNDAVLDLQDAFLTLRNGDEDAPGFRDVSLDAPLRLLQEKLGPRQHIGPGEGYQAWLRTAECASWRREAQRSLAASTYAR